MIAPTPTTIGELLSVQTRFQVPKFQRPYTWTGSEVDEFLDDLEAESKAKRGLFLGSILLDISAQSDGKIVIVDGQQRLTSIFLLLIACRERARVLIPEIAPEIHRKIGFIDEVTAESLGPRLLASDTIRQVFEHMANNKWDGVVPQRIAGQTVKRQANRVRKVFDHFSVRVQKMGVETLQLLLRGIYASRIIRIDIDSDEEAFSLFERTNARGTDLEVSDLLKNYLYQQKVPELEEKWKEVVDNADSTITKMLKYFYVSKKGYVTKSELYRDLKAFGKQEGATYLIQALSDFSKFYAVVKREDNEGVLKKYFDTLEVESIGKYQDRYGQLYLSLQALRLFRVSQVYPLLYAAISCFIRLGGAKDNDQAKRFVSLVEDLERYHFVNNAVCDRVGNEVERLYAGYCEKFEAAANFVDVTKSLQLKLREGLAGKSEFVTRFCDISYSPETIPLIAYIFDRINNTGRKPGERVCLYNPNNVRANHNIEHFYPQKPRKNGEESSVEDESQDFIDNIGNLLVISFHLNSKMGNASPKDKIAQLTGPKAENLGYIKTFVQAYGHKADSWGRDAVFERAKQMASEAYDKVWALE